MGTLSVNSFSLSLVVYSPSPSPDYTQPVCWRQACEAIQRTDPAPPAALRPLLYQGKPGSTGSSTLLNFPPSY